MEGGAQVVVISYHQKSETALDQVQDYHLFFNTPASKTFNSNNFAGPIKCQHQHQDQLLRH